MDGSLKTKLGLYSLIPIKCFQELYSLPHPQSNKTKLYISQVLREQKSNSP